MEQSDKPNTGSKTDTAGPGSEERDGSVFGWYTPHVWQVDKDTIYAAVRAVDWGIDLSKELLSQHEAHLGRTTRKNKEWAETMEREIRHMERALEMLRNCGRQNTEATNAGPEPKGTQ